MAYDDPYRNFAAAERFPRDVAGGGDDADGYHLSGSTLLRWNELEVAMNWGTHIMRSSHDRCALTVRVPRANRELRDLACGGGSYNHSSFGQSIIVVDEGLQHSTPAEIVSHDVVGSVQYVMARSEEHYPGTAITRTFALIDRHVLVVDRVEATDGKAHTVDWQLLGAGGKLSVPAEARDGSWTDKPDDRSGGYSFGGGVESHQYAKTDQTFTEGNGRLTVLGALGTEIMAWGGQRPAMMVRRRDVKRTDVVALLSLGVARVEQLPVARGDGKPADAVGLEVTLRDGRALHAIVSYEADGAEVRLGDLSTRGRFATDYPVSGDAQ